jgi:hypothetical protein
MLAFVLDFVRAVAADSIDVSAAENGGEEPIDIIHPSTGTLFARRLLNRELTAPSTDTDCAACPSFKYDDDNAGADVGVFVATVFIGVAICISCCCRAKNKQQQPELQQQQPPQTVGQSRVMMQPMGGQHQQQWTGSGSPQPTMVQVIVPPGVTGGQQIAVQSPAGMISAVVPQGMSPGSIFVISVAPAQPAFQPLLMPAFQPAFQPASAVAVVPQTKALT